MGLQDLRSSSWQDTYSIWHLYGIKDGPDVLGVFIRFVELITVQRVCVSLNMRPSHYLRRFQQLWSMTVLRYKLRVAAVAAYFINRHIRAERTSVVLIKADGVEMSTSPNRASLLLTLLAADARCTASLMDVHVWSQWTCCLLNP